MKNNKGISMIALVVTIIVILILSVVSLNTVFSENGIITRAIQAQEDSEGAIKREKIEIETTEAILKLWIEGGQNIEKVTDTNPGVLEGSGTENDPWTINSIEDLVAFSNSVNGGRSYKDEFVALGLSLDFDSDLSYVAPRETIKSSGTPIDYNNDGTIDSIKTELTSRTGYGFKQIGRINNSTMDDNFEGTFDGRNHQIINIYMFNKNSDSNLCDLGFFRVNKMGLIKNLTLNGEYFLETTGETPAEDDEYWALCGGIASENLGVIYNCYSNVGINVISNVVNVMCQSAGISGSNRLSGVIKECYNLGKIRLEANVNSYQHMLAGIVAINEGEIESCYNFGEIEMDAKETSLGEKDVAGICSINIENGKVENCINIGNISSYVNSSSRLIIQSGITAITNIGDGNIRNCINYGQIDVTDVGTGNTVVGGINAYIVGNNFVENCENYGNINITKTNTVYNQYDMVLAGGLIGRSLDNCVLINSHNEGKVFVEGKRSELWVGGLICIIHQYGTIQNSYNLGEISTKTLNGSVNVNGIVKLASNITIDKCYNEGKIHNILTSENVNNSSSIYINGIADSAKKIINSYNKGDLESKPIDGFVPTTLKASADIYGITCSADEIKNCYNIGNISVEASSTYNAGIGYADEIFNCYNVGNLSVKAYTGRASVYGVSDEPDIIESCYNFGNLDIEAKTNIYASGILEESYTEEIKDLYNCGNIKAKSLDSSDVKIAAICIYENYYDDNDNELPLKVTNCYNSGTIQVLQGNKISGIDGQTIQGQAIDIRGLYTILNSKVKGSTELCEWKMSSGEINKGYPIISL